jgi:hypothetical protein
MLSLWNTRRLFVYISLDGILQKAFFENVAGLLATGGVFLMSCALARKYQKQFGKNVAFAVAELTFLKVGRNNIIHFRRAE